MQNGGVYQNKGRIKRGRTAISNKFLYWRLNATNVTGIATQKGWLLSLFIIPKNQDLRLNRTKIKRHKYIHK